MNISLKSQKEIQVMAGGLLYHIDLIRDVLIKSSVYQGMRGRAGLYPDCEDENFMDQFICWLMFRMWVANKVAFIIQYGNNIDLREDLPDVKPHQVTINKLAADLNNLDYNIYSNGGQYWLDHEWHLLFKLILERIQSAVEPCCRGGVK